MYKALYRDFRPDSFDGLIGQDHIVRILKSQLASGSVSHAYLFCGTRGTGKTTTARILAKALNCTGEGEKPCCACENCRAISQGSFVDVIEIDAASNNGVENIRDLRDNINYQPAAGRYKVYIIDEVHMLSTGAFNALLKTIEEPPSYVVFILATTEPQKVPATILSRCVRLDFRRVSEQLLIENMKMICDARGIDAEQSALALIAINADGSVRDSLSILEQCITAGSVLRRDDVVQILGTAGEEALIELTGYVNRGDASSALLQIDRLIASGIDVRLLMKQWLEHFRNLLLVKYLSDPARMLNMSMENAERVGMQAAEVSSAFIDRSIRELTGTISGTKWSSRPRVMLEMSTVKLCASQETEEAFAFRYDGAAAVYAGSPAEKPGAPEKKTDSAEEKAPEQGIRSEKQEEAPAAGRSAEPPKEKKSPEDQIADGFYDEGSFEAGYELYDEMIAEAGGEHEPGQDGIALTEEMWQQCLDRAASKRGIITRCLGRSHFVRAEGDVFLVRCDDRNIEQLMDGRGRSTIEEAVSECLGREMKLGFDSVGKQPPGGGKKQKTGCEKKAALEEYFGRDVEIVRG